MFIGTVCHKIGGRITQITLETLCMYDQVNKETIDIPMRFSLSSKIANLFLISLETKLPQCLAKPETTLKQAKLYLYPINVLYVCLLEIIRIIYV